MTTWGVSSVDISALLHETLNVGIPTVLIPICDSVRLSTSYGSVTLCSTIWPDGRVGVGVGDLEMVDVHQRRRGEMDVHRQDARVEADRTASTDRPECRAAPCC